MKKTNRKFLILLILIIIPIITIAGAKNAVYFEWSWQGEKSGYFMTTGSGLVQGWSYDRPEGPDMHFIYKPVEKFPNATCDSEAITVNENWKPQNLYNVLYPQYKPVFMTIFPDLDKVYLLCGYPID